MAKDEKKTITVNEVEYNLDDLTPRQSTLLNHVNDLDRKLGNAQFNLDQLHMGRQKALELLAADLEAEPEEAEEIAAE
jgi:hypothetical protein